VQQHKARQLVRFASRSLQACWPAPGINQDREADQQVVVCHHVNES